jgi:hypothetical protein
VMWISNGDTKQGQLAARWIARATIHGYCKAESECRPPAAESVEIVSVTAR